MTPQITKFLRRQDFYKGMFWWILSKKDSFTSASTDECIRTFYTKFKIDPEKFPMDTARVVYQRMNKEFVEEEERLKEQFANGTKTE